MANQDHFRKLLIRSALVTSSTIAALFGAQMLMLLDGEEFTDVSNASPVEELNETVAINSTVAGLDQVSVGATATQIAIQRAVPHITILRQSGQDAQQQQTANNPTVLNNNQSIQPPNPVQIAAPAPVIVQQQSSSIVGQQQSSSIVVQQQSAPAPSRTRSSR